MIFISIAPEWRKSFHAKRAKISRRERKDFAYRSFKGEEVGRFNMGSTVILLFPKDTIEWSKELTASSVVKLGQRLATSK